MALPAKPMTGRIESPKKMAVAPPESFAKARKPFIAASIAAIDVEGHGAKGVPAGSVPERHDSPENRGKVVASLRKSDCRCHDMSQPLWPDLTLSSARADDPQRRPHHSGAREGAWADGAGIRAL